MKIIADKNKSLRFIGQLCFSMWLLAFIPHRSQPIDFLHHQLGYPRFKSAYSAWKPQLTNMLKAHELNADRLHVLIEVIKDEKTLRLYGKSTQTKTYSLLLTKTICASSGLAGPKNKQGDGQVPEGFYHIDRFNPTSAYHLSLGVSYPNAVDKWRNPGVDWGGDIFIHGHCVTIGCIPLTDQGIEPVYILCVWAKNSGQQSIPVYIYPTDFSKNGYPSNNKLLIPFWDSLKKAQTWFVSHLSEIPYGYEKNGTYSLPPSGGK